MVYKMMQRTPCAATKGSGIQLIDHRFYSYMYDNSQIDKYKIDVTNEHAVHISK